MLLSGLLILSQIAAAKGSVLPATALSVNQALVGRMSSPNLAGQKAGYITKQLQAFKPGERKDPTMSAMAQPLTEQAMEGLAANFSVL